jgi:L-idonate 5-dehydrogenase
VLVCDEAQAVPVPPAMSAAQAAFAEPFAVCLHAVNRAGPLLGKRVLVTGAGPIGALTVIAARPRRCAGDRRDRCRRCAARRGSQGWRRCDDQRSEKDALARYEADKGTFDVMFEASGNAKALAGGSPSVRPQGVSCRSGSRAAR